jgi:hypothetical protein
VSPTERPARLFRGDGIRGEPPVAAKQASSSLAASASSGSRAGRHRLGQPVRECTRVEGLVGKGEPGNGQADVVVDVLRLPAFATSLGRSNLQADFARRFWLVEDEMGSEVVAEQPRGSPYTQEECPIPPASPDQQPSLASNGSSGGSSWRGSNPGSAAAIHAPGDQAALATRPLPSGRRNRRRALPGHVTLSRLTMGEPFCQRIPE